MSKNAKREWSRIKDRLIKEDAASMPFVAIDMETMIPWHMTAEKMLAKYDGVAINSETRDRLHQELRQLEYEEQSYTTQAIRIIIYWLLEQSDANNQDRS